MNDDTLTRVRDVLDVLRAVRAEIAREPVLEYREAMLVGAQREALEQIERAVKHE